MAFGDNKLLLSGFRVLTRGQGRRHNGSLWSQFGRSWNRHINSPAVPVCVNLQNGNNILEIIDKFVVHQLVSIFQSPYRSQVHTSLLLAICSPEGADVLCAINILKQLKASWCSVY